MANNSTLYILNNKKEHQIIMRIIDKYNLDLCYRHKDEKIFRNDKILISCNRKYNSIHIIGNDGVVYERIKNDLKGK